MCIRDRLQPASDFVPVFNITVCVTDGGGLSTCGNFTVQIIGSLPAFPEDEYMVTLNEIIEPSFIASVTASDRDVDVNDLFDYNVVQALPYGDFIQANNGSVYLTTCCLDFEDNQKFMLTLQEST